MSLPTGYDERKALPIVDGVLSYFPDALLAVAAVSATGAKQHQIDGPLRWDRTKSMDQFNTAVRHIMDHQCFGIAFDTDGTRHLAKAAWRILAALQLAIEEEGAAGGSIGLLCTCGLANV
jgi:hypothetical protein